MTRNQIPPDVREFVRRDINSVFQLEVLLLLHRTRDRLWTVMEVSQELGIDPEIAERQLVSLIHLGLIQATNTIPVSYSYDPDDEKGETIIDKLALSFVNQRVAIFSLILSDSNNRIRRFAEAFRIIRGAD